jgi:hypothetical protein
MTFAVGTAARIRASASSMVAAMSAPSSCAPTAIFAVTSNSSRA